MTDFDARLATLLAVPERAPDIAFANESALCVAAEAKLTARLAADRATTAATLLATAAVATGLWLFAHTAAFDGVTGGGIGGFAAVGAVLMLWLATGASGALASD